MEPSARIDSTGAPLVAESAVLAALASFVPAQLLRQIARDARAPQAARAETLHGAALFADIRGFTALAEKLAARGELTARIYGLMPIRSWESLARAGIQPGFGSEWVREFTKNDPERFKRTQEFRKQVAETRNFRIYHRASRTDVERLARAAARVRRWAWAARWS